MPEQERPTSPLNLSVRHPFPKSELKCEDGRQLKQSSAISPILGVSPPRSASPPAWRSSQASPSTWSRGETARIWSPAVTCEKENSLSTSSNNNNNIEAKVSYLGVVDSKPIQIQGFTSMILLAKAITQNVLVGPSCKVCTFR